MRNKILSFDDFICESTISRPNYWEVNHPDKWQALQDLGFRDVTTERMKKSGPNVILMNDDLPVYPGGIVYQDSGYLRDKTKSSGFITSNQNWEQAADYLIHRFTQLKLAIPPGIPSNIYVWFLRKANISAKTASKKLSVDTSSKIISIKGDFQMNVSDIPEFLSTGYKFGFVRKFLFNADGNKIPLTKAECAQIFPSECGEFVVTEVNFSPDCKNVPIFPPTNKIIHLIRCGGIENLNCLNPDQPDNLESLRVLCDLKDLYGLNIKNCDEVKLGDAGDYGCFLSFPALIARDYGPYYAGNFLKTTAWDVPNFLRVLKEGTEKQKNLMITLPVLDSNFWNSELEKNPGETVHLLAPVWNDPEFSEIKKGIKIPPGFEDELDLFSGFSDLGLF